MSERTFPDEPAGPFPAPPIEFVDGRGREIEIRACEGARREREALEEMYDAFDPADRAQGIPPERGPAVRRWLDRVLTDECLNVLAWHGDVVAGHGMLVPEDGDYELAIFVLQDYQEAGIGTRLIRGLLGYGERQGVECVWLTVERWNEPAIGLYRKIGFETTDAESFELEMSLRLAPDERRRETGSSDR